MDFAAQFLLSIGGILLLGLATDMLGHRTFLPRVTLLLLFGVAIGKEFFDLIPPILANNFEIIADMALLMVGFLLGGRLTRKTLEKLAGKIMWISLSAAVGTTVVVVAVLVLAGVSVEMAILLGCIAAATAPSATIDVVMESDHRGPFADLLLSVVAIDDVWGLILFSLGVAVVAAIIGAGTGTAHIFAAATEVGGALLLGLLIGFPAAYLTGRIKPGQPMLTEALGIVFVCGGLALWLEVSFLITAIVVGAVVANFARHHDYPFHAIEGVEWPMMAIFFVLAGASLDISALGGIGVIGLAYIVARAIGKITGAGIGGQLSHSDAATRQWMGVAMLPQAGVAIGMALVAGNQFPDYRQTLLTVVISSTVFFEIVGPVFTRIALRRTQADPPRI